MIAATTQEHLLDDRCDVQTVQSENIAGDETATSGQTMRLHIEPMPLARIARPVEPHRMVEARALKSIAVTLVVHEIRVR